MASTTIKLRVQEKPARKGQKMKPALIVSWSVDKSLCYPLAQVQKWFPTCKSLRKNNGSEYTWKDLLSLQKKNEIVYASDLESSLPVKKKLPNGKVKKTDDNTTKSAPHITLPLPLGHEINCQLCASYRSCRSIRFSRHAMERCCERTISVEQIQQAIQEGQFEHPTASRGQNSGKVASRVWTEDIGLVLGADGILVTVWEATASASNESINSSTKMEQVPCDDRLAQELQNGKSFYLWQNKSKVRVQYKRKQGCLEVSGKAEGISNFKLFLRDCVVRLYSEKDTCGRVIGKGGANIMALKKEIDVAYLSVFWDGLTKELVFVSPTSIISHTEFINNYVASLIKPRNHPRSSKMKSGHKKK